jgi:hypothetical protein
MFKGTVSFTAQVEGAGVRFIRLAYNPNERGVDKVEIEGPDGQTIQAVVHLLAVPTPEEGIRRARQVFDTALTRLAFHYGLVVQTPAITGELFLPLQQGGHGVSFVASRCLDGCAVNRLVATITPNALRARLQQEAPGEQYFGLFVSALRATGPAEQFMHLYNLLLMFCHDDQVEVDDFIRAEEPRVPQSPCPRKPGVQETVYTRLRNELVHAQAGIDREDARREMAGRLRGLIELARRAIELHP